MADPLYGKNANSGLHVLKDAWGQKAHLQAQCLELARNLSLAIARTVVPTRTKPYFDGDRDPREVQLEESKWERALWAWSQKSRHAAVVNCWHRFVYYQLPLFGTQQKDKWGYIDLLGIDNDGTLAVLELKKAPVLDPNGRSKNSETPLRMILEAAAYAVALKRNWPTLRPQLVEHLNQNGLRYPVPAEPAAIRLIGIAPNSYWADWLPISAKGLTVEPATWEAFRYLLNALRENDLPTSFVTVSGSHARPSSIKARLLTGFPLG